MRTRYFALIFGVMYVLVGIAGFIPGLHSHPAANAPHMDVTTSYGYLLGMFPVNILHNLVHIVIGLAGIVAYARVNWAQNYSRTLFLVYGLLVFMGFMPNSDTVWGLIPIFGSDTWLHAASAVIAGYFGFVEGAPSHVAHAGESPAH